MEIASDEGTGTVFVDYIEFAPQLLLFGNQNVIHSVSRIGREAGFEVTVASARGSRTSCDYFPYADKVIGTHPTNLTDHTNDKTYVILMSHNLFDDTLALETLLSDFDVPYVGLMGPRKCFEEIRDDLVENGTTFTDAQLQRVSTPVGLDLGGDEPSQIALSIVSEVLAVSNGRSGGHLEDREGPIHERSQPTTQ